MADLTVQSLLNTAVYNSYTGITLGTKTVAQLKADIQTATGVNVAWFDLVLNEQVLTEGDTLTAAGVADGDALRTHNKIGRLADRETKQKAKLDLAALKRGVEYDITELPTQYSGDAVVDNPNAAGLLEGRPWSASGMTLTNLAMYLDPVYASSGTSVPDQTNNGYTSTLVNATHNTTNDYFEFNGSNAYIRSPDFYNTAVSNPDSFSLGVWVYPTNQGVVVSITDTATPSVAYHYSALEMIDSGGNPVPYFGIWDAGITSVNGTALSYNTWYHMMITYNGTTLRGYLNGSEVGNTNVVYDSPLDSTSTNHYFLFGASDTTHMGDGSYFNGRMGSIRLYSDAISASEVLENYNNDKARYGY